MSIHTAKDEHTREEVIDILKRNVSLYKNEPEFVNYIVDLAIYLLEHLAEAEDELEIPSPQTPLPRRQSPSFEFIESVPAQALNTTPGENARGAIYSQPPVTYQTPPVSQIPSVLAPQQPFQAPPMQGFAPPSSSPFAQPPASSFAPQQPPAMPAQPLSAQMAAPDSRMPKVQIDKGGRTRIYKVFRPHTISGEGAHCPICGSDTQGQRNCPNCGNVL